MTFTTHLATVAHAAQLLAEERDTANVVGGGFTASFFVVAALAIAVFLLGLDLVRRLRRAKYRAEIHEELTAEVAERDAAATDTRLGEANEIRSEATGAEATKAEATESDEPSQTNETDDK